MPPNTIAKEVRCVYGTRDAGKLREDTCTVSRENGISNRCSEPMYFPSCRKDFMVVVHGNYFTTLGLDATIGWFERNLQ